ncbi:Gamma-glutamyltranspeptidase / glutathione hydrolase [Planctomycetales bacterium 10988]|nr:Gamma-glutamyltranspeptidase / glutathione hydrolase [Planctomycetales bacterium 10988]
MNRFPLRPRRLLDCCISLLSQAWLLLILGCSGSANLPAIGQELTLTPAKPPLSPLATETIHLGDTLSATGGMIVSARPEASKVGAEILEKGGNAVDAAIATGFALAVTFPEAGNIGGGGFMMIAGSGKTPSVCIDYRETAPAAATERMFPLFPDRHTLKMVGVPGTVRGFALAHQRYGKLPWKDLVLPSVKLAEEGFVLGGSLAVTLNTLVENSTEPQFAEFRRVYGKQGGKEEWKATDTIRLPDLAKTLKRIAEQGPDEFYTGKTAELLTTQMQQGEGLITLEDLKNYQAIEREPITGTFREYQILASPPPSSGGMILVEMLNMLETFPQAEHARFDPLTLHRMIEIMRRAYRDRAAYLGDPAFTEIPDKLTTKEYAQQLAATIDPERATSSASIAGDIPLTEKPEPNSTTHFSVIDANGMAVSNTYTLELAYGSRMVVKGAGFLLNNEMGDFNRVPGYTDTRGFIGTPPNLIAPGKRMLSSQNPVIVKKEGKVYLITGSPGGRTIINTVFQVLVNVLEYELSLPQSVALPRIHHGWFPEVVSFEGIYHRDYRDAIEALKQKGHNLSVLPISQGDAHSILVQETTDKQTRYLGVADQRRFTGTAAGVEP